MKKLEIYVCSTLENGTASFFRKSHKVGKLYVPPEIGTKFTAACLAPANHRELQVMEVKNVRVKENSARVLFETETSSDTLRDCLIPEGYEEVSSFFE